MPSRTTLSQVRLGYIRLNMLDTGNPPFLQSSILTDFLLLDFPKALGSLCRHEFDGFYRHLIRNKQLNSLKLRNAD